MHNMLTIWVGSRYAATGLWWVMLKNEKNIVIGWIFIIFA